MATRNEIAAAALSAALSVTGLDTKAAGDASALSDAHEISVQSHSEAPPKDSDTANSRDK